MWFNIEQGIWLKKLKIHGNLPNLPLFPPSKVPLYTAYNIRNFDCNEVYIKYLMNYPQTLTHLFNTTQIPITWHTVSHGIPQYVAEIHSMLQWHTVCYNDTQYVTAIHSSYVTWIYSWFLFKLLCLLWTNMLLRIGQPVQWHNTMWAVGLSVWVL